MRRGRTFFWTSIGSVVAAVAVVLALIQVTDGTPRAPASSPVAPPGGPSSQASESAPVVVPEASGRSSFSYLANLHPSGGLGELVTPGPVKISGSIYPKSISFYCNVGDPTAFPVYKLKHNARRLQATIGLPATSPPQFQAGILRTIVVSVRKPRTVDVNLKGVHALRLECFGSGNSATGGEAVAVAWGNARVTRGR